MIKGFLAGIIFVMLVAIITGIVARYTDSTIARQKKQIEWHKAREEELRGTVKMLMDTLKIYGYPETLSEHLTIKKEDKV